MADCGGVIDGANSIILTNTVLRGALEGIKMWKTGPVSGSAVVTMKGGSLTAAGAVDTDRHQPVPVARLFLFHQCRRSGGATELFLVRVALADKSASSTLSHFQWNRFTV
jgi:hypothetical protein